MPNLDTPATGSTTTCPTCRGRLIMGEPAVGLLHVADGSPACRPLTGRAGLEVLEARIDAALAAGDTAAADAAIAERRAYRLEGKARA